METYSHATITNGNFTRNKATDDGGAIYCRRRSQITIRDSHLQANEAMNSGGSMLVQLSLVTITLSIFENEVSFLGYGRSISVEHVGNVTIEHSVFVNCIALNGGSVSVRAESNLNVKHSIFDNSYSTSNAGALSISERSFMLGESVIIKNCKSTSGAGVFVTDTSQIILKEFSIGTNKANESGGAVFCKGSDMTLDEGTVELNYAKLDGGAVYSEHCKVTFDFVTFSNNSAALNGGAINSESSVIDIHNCEAKYNSARSKGEFAMISSKSELKINYLALFDVKINSISIANSSEAEFRHVNLRDGNYYCPITVFNESHIHLVTIYSHNVITDETYRNSQNTRKDVCIDKTSSVEGTPTG